MPMEAAEIHSLITEALPDAKLTIEDLRGDGDHYAVTVESGAFYGLSIADQHRMIFRALQGRVGGILKALTLSTYVPESYRPGMGIGDES
ncbi:MAG: BolA family transcriptional regulator [Proteobacteria bacterium]|jgi:stress-induced morphogen|nr:BolA/IbaG family iron-sulfur metabolism protein [Alphaproteobacteria bacterium]NCC03209.1 BolA family transcriptional regulator [Pseudomonadota bacterium]